jgi:hypothetical protein
MGGKMRYFNEEEGRKGEVREDLLIIYMFGSNDRREGKKMIFNYIYVDYTCLSLN